ncbi:MAG TPA: SusC/RagA family TonB-linked outer membrane protein [Bacteroidales bacterium]|nr:SusC/RagA family TonB-linked outer membrane protein [Bacteroidales bacterium]
MKRVYLLFLFLLTTSLILTAQTRIITGTVTGSEDSKPVTGCTVQIKGTTTGILTDTDGKYSLSVPQNATSLTFSYIGMKSQDVVIGEHSVIDVILQPDIVGLSEVVVTALGISREKKSLGYATQQVTGDAIATVKTSNFMNSLSGKLSGVVIKRNQNLGGSTNVIVRGSKSFQNTNQVLYVVDGVPINNNIGSYSTQNTGGVGYDYGNTAGDINPEDIESINVLKGSSAAALYGSRASGGVIMITTKRGKEGKEGVGISINSNVTVSSIDKSTFPTYQDQYGAGYGQYYGPDGDAWFESRTASGNRTTSDPVNDPLVDWVPTTEDASYGAKFDGHQVWGWYSVDPESPWYMQSKPWLPAKNGPITFFETPVTFSNSVAIDKTFTDGSLRLSYNNYNTKGLMPNSKLNKDNFLINGSWNISKRLTATASANFIRQNATGRNSTGYNDNILTNMRQWAETNLDYKDQLAAYNATQRNLTWNYNSALNYPIYTDNPYFQRYKNYETDTRSRTIGYMTITYKIFDWLDVFGRAAVDTYDEFQEERRAVGSVAAEFGVSRARQKSGYLRRDNTFSEYNFDIMLNFRKNLTESLNLNGFIGANERRTNSSGFTNSTNGGLSVPDIYSIQNSLSPLPYPTETISKVGVRSQFASISLGYRNLLYLDATARQDYASTLPETNNRYFYPSVTTAVIFSELLKQEWLSFGKVRLNYAQVGNLAGYDQLIDTYVVNTPMNGANNQLPKTKKNPDLKNESTNSLEAGLEASFFKNRIGMDLAVYKTNSIDQIMPVLVSQTSGYQYLMVNSGEIENKGIELMLNATPVLKGSFRWDVAVNWGMNRSKVLSLYPGLSNLLLGSFQGGVTLNAAIGEPYGAIKGSDYTYDNDGNKIISAITGLPVKSKTSSEIIGNVNPDWNGGISNTLTYKNLALSFLIDIQQGGDVFSLDMYYGMSSGLYPETVIKNDLGNPVRDPVTDDETSGGYIIKGVNVVRESDGTIISSTPNTTRVDATTSDGWGYAVEPDRAFIYDASYVKLREVNLYYSIPSGILKNTFIKGASLGITGSNLWILHKNLPYADPESGLSAGNIQGYSIGSLPGTRDFSFNVKINF